ncbi:MULTISPECIES: hypothetical protein [unclassified Micromonospora]|uniref:hypothetical protein n=1 Tax=unclassified Micromonospora TaxID=2617518 RepID=UPI002FF4210B
MATSRSIRLPRRGVLGIPLLLTASALATTARPAKASAAGKIECLADLLGAS